MKWIIGIFVMMYLVFLGGIGPEGYAVTITNQMIFIGVGVLIGSMLLYFFWSKHKSMGWAFPMVDEVEAGVQPATAAQRLGLPPARARGQIPKNPSPDAGPPEWTAKGNVSNVAHGLVSGGRSGEPSCPIVSTDPGHDGLPPPSLPLGLHRPRDPRQPAPSSQLKNKIKGHWQDRGRAGSAACPGSV